MTPDTAAFPCRQVVCRGFSEGNHSTDYPGPLRNAQAEAYQQPVETLRRQVERLAGPVASLTDHYTAVARLEARAGAGLRPAPLGQAVP